jgi:hypothetical protein
MIKNDPEEINKLIKEIIDNQFIGESEIPPSEISKEMLRESD